MAGKVAIVTGAAHGMGEAIAKLFCAEGAKVVLADLLRPEGEAVAQQIQADGGEASFVRTDVSSAADWQGAIAHAVSTYGTLNVLVNNAGISGSAFADQDSVEGWDTILAVNAKSVFLGTTLAVPPMHKAGGGAIVNISSIMGIVGSASNHPAYHASKAAVRNYTKAAACRYGDLGIRVNSIHPGYFPSMLSSARNEAEAKPGGNLDILVQKLPLKRMGRLVDIAYATLFLACDEAQYITGAELAIDGGYLAQ